ncbi:putative allows the formation of correctly charged Gln-tRNA(Gln) through the transamidation of misacylated Glu-tRNA(Gln) in the mitochondria [Lyophyllum shimeji]|uniref:Glutamyl-tRNA(Gln) amidotransferase subunit A, mitochondrial n=1 Tax=Lyophyllum shimeji TaxID=47721 RepID=A0A9P3UNH4_LYOSH|nr:putative allows the formation of correctly charged Gln-tRNA(Gln) through the transamidation of misacylated Glu-tRNA(Gln) in the mitochondria [Lyophyllum shimeji]
MGVIPVTLPNPKFEFTQARQRQLSTSVSLDSTTCRARIAAYNPSINAFVRTSPPPPPPPPHPSPLAHETLPLQLATRPVAVKDSICTRGMGAGCASEMLRDFDPPYDATVVTLLRAAGADIIGKTNCDEFGMGSMNIHSIHGPVINPFGSPAHRSSMARSTFPSAPSSSAPPLPPPPSPEARSAGGSSGGSAAAVAAGMCFAALGTDTGGSTRLPAAYCGVVGLKPSYGLLSRWGVVSFADSLDCVGVMAGCVEDTELVFDVLNVYDEKDPTAALPETREAARRACERRMEEMGWSEGRLDGLRIGIPQEYFPAEMTDAVLQPLRRTIAGLQAKGAVVVPVSMPATAYALSAYYVLASAEASSCLARFDGVEYGLHVRPPPGTDLATTSTAELYALSRSAGFGREVKKRILLGTYALSADAFDNYFLQAQRVRQLVKDDFDRVFGIPDYRQCTTGETGSEGVDVLVHPSAIQTAPRLDGEGGGGLETYVQDVLTVPASLAGLPALSVPVAGEGWPVGVSVVGQWGCESVVFAVGRAAERI